MNRELLTQCQGEESCTAKIQLADIFDGYPDLEKGGGDFIFAQVACNSTKEPLDLKRSCGLLCCLIGLFMIIFSTFSLQLVQAEAQIDERKVGMLNVAVSEFTVQGEIPAAISQKFSN